MSLYETLGIDKHASPKAIRSAYRQAVKKCHPDVHPGHEEEFERVSTAHEVLMDPDRRAHYDATGEVKPTTANNAVAEILETLSLMFDRCLNKMGEIGRDPLKEDLVKWMLNAMDGSLMAMRVNIEQLENNRGVLIKFLGRFEVNDDDKPNHMEAVVRGKCQQYDNQIRPQKLAMENLRAARTYLEGCSFRSDVPAFLTQT